MSHASLIIAIEPSQNIEEAVALNMEPFCEQNAWFEDGSRWDWYEIGGRYAGKFAGEDIALVEELSPNKYLAYQEKNLRTCYAEAMAELKKTKDYPFLEIVYGVRQGESEADFVKRNTQGAWFPSSYAFLKDRHWHETARLGWFGTNASTECEKHGRKDKPEWKCLFKHKSGAQIVSWNSDRETWQLKFYNRFIQPLSPETRLVCVDYHV